MGDGAVIPQLRELATCTDQEIRLMALQALAHLEPKTDHELRLFSDALADSYPPVRVAAAVGLLRNRSTAHDVLEILVRALDQAERLPRRIAVQGLADIEAPIPFLDERLQKLMVDDDQNIGLAAIRRAARLRLDSPEVVSLFERMLQGQVRVGSVRRDEALEALAALGATAVPVAERLLQARETLGDAPVNFQVLYLLKQLGPTAQSALPSLRLCWQTCDVDMRPYVLEALRAVDIGETIVPYVEAGLTAITDAALCGEALECVWQWDGRFASGLLSRVVTILAQACPQLQETAAQAIHRCGEGWLPEVVTLLQSSNPRARVGALQALGYCAPHLQDSLRHFILAGLVDRDLAVQHAAREAFHRPGWTRRDRAAARQVHSAVPQPAASGDG